MVDILMIRRNRTMKEHKVNNKKDEFNFEDGKYYIKQECVMYKKFFLFFAKPFLLYYEGIPTPIDFKNIKTIKNNDENEILIDSKSIHNIVSTDVLSVLAHKQLSKFELLLLILVIFTCLFSIAGAVT